MAVPTTSSDDQLGGGDPLPLPFFPSSDRLPCSYGGWEVPTLLSRISLAVFSVSLSFLLCVWSFIHLVSFVTGTDGRGRGFPPPSWQSWGGGEGGSGLCPTLDRVNAVWLKKTKKKGRGMGSPHLAGHPEGEGNRVLSYSRQSVYSMIKTKTSAKTCAA